jgi:hypothetical protein
MKVVIMKVVSMKFELSAIAVWYSRIMFVERLDFLMTVKSFKFSTLKCLYSFLSNS